MMSAPTSTGNGVATSPGAAAEPAMPLQSNNKYEELNVIGTGAYGTVYRARDLHNPGQIVALKKVRVALTEDGVPLSTLREIALLRQLETYRHPNIVRLLDVCHGGPTERGSQLTLFLVFEHVEQDLYSYLKRAPYQGLSYNRIREMSRDILSGVDFLHSHRILHRDLKPQNLLVSSAGRVKLADFGLAKTYDSDMKLTSVVVTLWYRPPEVLLGVPYNTAVDVWSAGCVLVELNTLQPLFHANSEGELLDKIFRILGRPDGVSWPASASVERESFPPHRPRDLATVFPNMRPQPLSLIKGMLVLDPARRLTALDCLQHSYFTDEPLT